MNLSRQARETITARGATIAGYVRHHYPAGKWGGDACGCDDDRCIGFHHDADDECGCLPVLLDLHLEPLSVHVHLEPPA